MKLWQLVALYINDRKFTTERVRCAKRSALEAWLYWRVPRDSRGIGNTLGVWRVDRLNKRVLERRIQAFRDDPARRCGQLRHSTIKFYVNALRSMLMWASMQGYAPHGSAALVPKLDPEQGDADGNLVEVLSDDQFARVIAAARAMRLRNFQPNEIELFIRLCGDCGLRVAEAFWLQWSEIVEMNGRKVIRLAPSRTRGLKTRTAARYVPLTPLAQELIDRIARANAIEQASATEPLAPSTFVLPAAKRSDWKHVRHPHWSGIARRIRIVSGIQDFTFAKLRHTFATRWIASYGWEAASLEKLAMVMGHTTTDLARMYYIRRDPVLEIDLKEPVMAGE